MKLNFSMLKHKTFSIHEIFLAPLVVSKAIFFWSLSNILQCPSSHASQLPLIRKIWKTQNILDFNAHKWFLCISWCPSTSYPMLQSLMFWCLSLLEKEIFMFNLAPVVFWTSFFYTPTTYWLFSFCHSLLAFLFFYYFLSFFILGVVCLNVFLLLTKFRSFLKQNTTQNWILTKDVQNKECYIG